MKSGSKIVPKVTFIIQITQINFTTTFYMFEVGCVQVLSLRRILFCFGINESQKGILGQKYKNGRSPLNFDD